MVAGSGVLPIATDEPITDEITCLGLQLRSAERCKGRFGSRVIACSFKPGCAMNAGI